MSQAPFLGAEAAFLAQQLPRTFRVGTEEHREAQAQVGDQLGLQPGQFLQADVGERAAVGSSDLTPADPKLDSNVLRFFS